ncbi:MAG: DMT family transporter [Tissierellia bacterium]|nr:DMT family transporter [Tissierellia bacterium]
MLYIVLAIIGGFLTILSMVVNAGLGKEIGVFRGTFINYVVGLSLILIMVLMLGSFLDIKTLASIPFYAFLGGALGVIIVASSNVIIPKIPAIYTVLLNFIGQIVAGIIIDYIRFDFISKGKIIGGILVILGILYNSMIDKKQLRDGNNA